MKFDDHVEKADQIIERADALLNRHQDQAPSFAASLPPGSATTAIPVLTEMIEDGDQAETSDSNSGSASPASTSNTTNATTPPAASGEAAPVVLIEHLIGIEAEVTRAVEHWLQQELPELIERETRALASRVQAQISAHARATLATALSERIAAHLLAAEKRQQASKP